MKNANLRQTNYWEFRTLSHYQSPGIFLNCCFCFQKPLAWRRSMGELIERNEASETASLLLPRWRWFWSKLTELSIPNAERRLKERSLDFYVWQNFIAISFSSPELWDRVMARDALCVLNIMESMRMKSFTHLDIKCYRFPVPVNIRDTFSLNCGSSSKAPWRRRQVSSEVSVTSEHRSPIHLSKPLETSVAENFSDTRV